MSISPNVPSPQESYHYENTGTPRWIAVLFGVLFVALAAMGFFGYTAQSRMSQDLAKTEDANKQLLQRLDQANASLADLKGHLEVTEEKLGMTTAELAKAKSRAESIRKEQVAADQKLTTQLAQAQKDNEEKLGVVTTDLGGAKKDIETTRNDLEATKG
jgi:cell division protein FtsB